MAGTGDKPPPSLKAVQPFLMVAKQFAKRDPVVAYYANMYAVQEGIKLSKNDPTAKGYLVGIMDQLQRTKKTLKDEEAMESDVVAQAHIENVALKMFDYADTEDRAAQFHKNMVKAFFTCSQIFTTLRQFGELSEEIEPKMKYAKWKAVEIDRCLKNGITPTPGPPRDEEDEFGFGFGEPTVEVHVEPPGDQQRWIPPGAQQVLPPVPKPRQNIPPQEDPGYPPQQPGYPHQQPGYPPQQPGYPPQQPGYPPQQPSYPPQQPSYPPQQPSYPPQQPQPPSSNPASSSGGFSYQDPTVASGVTLQPDDITKAQKLCKFAGSALEYDDVQGAVEYLGKALKLLTTGKE